jgi:hypothetical protein
LRDSNNPELLKEIDEAVEKYKEEKRLEAEDDDDPALSDPDPHSDDDALPAPTGRVPRVHRQPRTYVPMDWRNQRGRVNVIQALYVGEVPLSELPMCLDDPTQAFTTDGADL